MLRTQIKILNKNKIVAMEGGRRVGYLKFVYPGDSSGKRNLVIDYVYVKPQYRRKGIANKLIKFILKHFKNVVWISLWTSEEAEKDGSYGLYKKLGFKELAYQADYYKSGVGTHLFVKKLS